MREDDISRGVVSSRYVGAWQQDRMTGWGRMSYSNGAEYSGAWVDR